MLNVLSGAGAQGVTAVAALWSIPQILQAVGPAGYGTYSIATALVGYFSIADLGLSNATLQRLARARASDDVGAVGRTIGTSLTLLGCVGVLLSLALFAAAPFTGDHLAGEAATSAQRGDVTSAVRWCALGAIPVFLRPVLDAIVSASERLTELYAATTFANLVRTVGAVVAVWIWPRAVTPVIVLVAASAGQCLVMVPLAARSVPHLRPGQLRVTRLEMRELLRVSIPLWLSQGIANIANQLDRFVVSGWFGLETLGQYAVAQDLATRLWIVPYIFSRAYFPRIARQLAHDSPREHMEMLRGYGIASILSCTIPAVPLAIFGSDVLAAWIGRRDLGVGPVILMWLAAGIVANTTSFAAFSILQVQVRGRAIAVASTVLLAVNVVGCALLPRFFGPTGVAISWSVGQAAASLAYHAGVWKGDRVSLLPDLARCVVAMLVVGAGAEWFLSAMGPVTLDLGGSTLRRLSPMVARLGAWCAIGGAVAALLFFGRARREAAQLWARRRRPA